MILATRLVEYVFTDESDELEYDFGWRLLHGALMQLISAGYMVRFSILFVLSIC
jgi:hypothetical protein